LENEEYTTIRIFKRDHQRLLDLGNAGMNLALIFERLLDMAEGKIE